MHRYSKRAGIAAIRPGWTWAGARVVAVTMTLAVALCLPACNSRTPSEQTRSSTETPEITGAPAGYNGDDISFASNMITHHQQAIKVADLALHRSTDSDITILAAGDKADLELDLAVLRVLAVQWKENPDSKVDGSGGAKISGMVDDATVAKLGMLSGTGFDKLWLQSMTELGHGAIEMANAEIAHGRNIDALGLAKQIVKSQEAEVARTAKTLAR